MKSSSPAAIPVGLAFKAMKPPIQAKRKMKGSVAVTMEQIPRDFGPLIVAKNMKNQMT